MQQDDQRVPAERSPGPHHASRSDEHLREALFEYWYATDRGTWPGHVDIVGPEHAEFRTEFLDRVIDQLRIDDVWINAGGPDGHQPKHAAGVIEFESGYKYVGITHYVSRGEQLSGSFRDRIAYNDEQIKLSRAARLHIV